MLMVSEQVKILLERMDLYPEEFVRPYESRMLNSKWGEVLGEGTFNRVERFLIKRKVHALRRKATQDQILATIMYENQTEEISPEVYSYPAMTTTERFSTRRMFTPKDIEKIKSQWYADDKK